MEFKEFKDLLFKKALNKGFEECEIYFSNKESIGISVYEQELEKYNINTTFGLSFRGKINGKIGYSYTEILDEEAIDMLITNAKEGANSIENDDVQFIYDGDKEYEKVNCYSKEIENLKELVSDAVEFEKSNEEDKSLSAYLEKVALVQDMDDLEAEDNYVMLMTVHSSKGLEFPTVFLVGMENGIFPNAACFEHDNQMEEARRLCYVGITRAEEKLYMTSAETRMIFGKTVAYGQSDFISEIPANIKDYVNINGKSSSNSFKNSSQTYGETRKTYNPHSIRGGMSASKANESLNKTLSGKSSGNAGIDELTMGRKVKHPKFGVGTLITKSKVGDDYKLTIAFDSQGVKHLMFSFAPLELL